MPLFKKQQKKEQETEQKIPRKRRVPKAVSATQALSLKPPSPSSSAADFAFVLIHPRITEKASYLMEGGVYSFEVGERANKEQIARAVREQYGVRPTHIRIVPIPTKERLKGGHRGRTAHGKKAYVFLKKGEKIEVV